MSSLNEENIKFDISDSHYMFIKHISSSINNYVSTIVKEKTEKYKQYDELIDLINELPLVKELKNKIIQLEKKIKDLESNNQNISLNISEKNAETSCEKENVVTCSFDKILDKDYTEEELSNLTPFYRDLWLKKNKKTNNEEDDNTSKISGDVSPRCWSIHNSNQNLTNHNYFVRQIALNNKLLQE